MTARVFAAALAAIFGIGLAFSPAETSARPAGLSGRPAAFHGAARAPLARPAVRAALPAARKALSGHGMFAHKHRHPIGDAAVGWWGGGWGSFYDPSNYIVLHDQPAQAYPAPGYPVVSEPEAVTIRMVPAIYEHRLGCQSQTQNVAESGGGERAITIMRC